MQALDWYVVWMQEYDAPHSSGSLLPDAPSSRPCLRVLPELVN
jgi:hypothetical protein